MMKLTKHLTKLLLSLLLLSPLIARSAQPTTYSVWEVEIQEGAAIAGQRYRFAVVDWPYGDVAQLVEFGNERLFIKDRVLGDVGLSTTEIVSWKNGEEKNISLDITRSSDRSSAMSLLNSLALKPKRKFVSRYV